ncbi:MAG: hypothetical protein ACI85F_002516 [Bacteroidia bacterium]|jgi:hypothetical protein
MNDCDVVPADTSSSARLSAPNLYDEDEQSTNAIEELAFRVFPNPSNGSISIVCNTESDKTVRFILTDAIGKQVYAKNYRCNGLSVNINDLAEGVYHCMLSVDGRLKFQEKLIIVKK